MAVDVVVGYRDRGPVPRQHTRAVERDPVPGLAAPSDAGLLEACQLGDVDSWGELVRRYERLVYAIPLREGLTAADAAEISQSTFEALVESLERIQEPDRIASWLMTVARRLTWRRRMSGRSEVSFDEVPSGHEPDGDDASAWVGTVTVHDAVAELPDPCRALVFGLFLDPDEPSYEEISRQLGIAIGSIGPMRSRCLDRLRSHLQP